VDISTARLVSAGAPILQAVGVRSNRPFVEELPELLRERGLSLRKLAQRADLNPSHLSRVLRRVDYKTPSGELVRRIAVALDLPYDYFPEYRASVVFEKISADGALRDELYERLR
jgi:transcriptional regulator with XRE-family HTH domain